MKWILPSVMFAALLTGCGVKSNYPTCKEAFDAVEGMDYDNLVKVWGPPRELSRTYDANAGASPSDLRIAASWPGVVPSGGFEVLFHAMAVDKAISSTGFVPHQAISFGCDATASSPTTSFSSNTTPEESPQDVAPSEHVPANSSEAEIASSSQSEAAAPTKTDNSISGLFPDDGLKTNFTGKVGKWKAKFILTKDEAGAITGTYWYYERPNTIYNLQGSVNADNSITLTELTDGQVSATCLLNARGDCLEGKMNNTDGRKLNMSLCYLAEEEAE